MMNSILKKSNWMILFPAGILFALVAAGPVFADYCGHVASFKSEKNAVVFVHKMKAKGIVAYYQKEDVPGKGEFYRAYIGGYKTLPLAQKALTKLKRAGEIESFEIQKMAVKNKEVAIKKTETAVKTTEPMQKPEKKADAVAQKTEPAQKQENKAETAAQKTEPAQKPESKVEAIAQTGEPVQKPENKAETVAQKNEPTQNPESKTELAKQQSEPVKQPEKKTETVAKKTEPAQKTEKNIASSIDTRHYYDGIKGIVLKNGRKIRGQIISIDENDVLKIRTRSGKISSYSFTKDVKEYITVSEP
jgi:outer membrane biosynthesis protein TonB